jgi:hypothetical protein
VLAREQKAAKRWRQGPPVEQRGAKGGCWGVPSPAEPLLPPFHKPTAHIWPLHLYFEYCYTKKPTQHLFRSRAVLKVSAQLWSVHLNAPPPCAGHQHIRVDGAPMPSVSHSMLPPPCLQVLCDLWLPHPHSPVPAPQLATTTSATKGGKTASDVRPGQLFKEPIPHAPVCGLYTSKLSTALRRSSGSTSGLWCPPPLASHARPFVARKCVQPRSRTPPGNHHVLATQERKQPYASNQDASCARTCGPYTSMLSTALRRSSGNTSGLMVLRLSRPRGAASGSTEYKICRGGARGGGQGDGVSGCANGTAAADKTHCLASCAENQLLLQQHR